ncbi:hypothetical protein C5167_022913 [Papaver somniferum]|uniref:Uncharacterized protein n=1 Tax=Papaver somniferum TaxID=3469 RepID=A0A4Y7JMA2_PAPSO|nr:hypothetical protein C5167_022913 [Papaver somniferum]
MSLNYEDGTVMSLNYEGDRNVLKLRRGPKCPKDYEDGTGSSKKGTWWHDKATKARVLFVARVLETVTS